MIDWSVALEAVPKLVCYLALLVASGACAAHWLRRLAGELVEDAASSYELDRRLASVLRIAALALVSALVARAWAHTGAAFGVSEPLWQNLRVVVWESEWGRGWRTQVLIALVLVAGAALVRSAPHAGWIAASIAATASAFAVALLGHATGEPLRVGIHGVHVLGAGLWLGTLAALRAACRPRGALDRMLSRFAPVALTAASCLAVSGAIAAWWYLGSFSSLWTSAYGRTLVIKLAFVAGVTACGFSNWRRYRAIRARRREPAGPAPAMVAVELLLAALVVAITAVLTELPHPDEP